MSQAKEARLADLLGALSFATDMAAGVPIEASIRTSVVAAVLARAAGYSEDAVSDAYYAALLRHLGCTSFAHEAAALANGDDHDLLRTFEGVEKESLIATAARTFQLGAESTTTARVASIARVLASPSAGDDLATAQCAQAAALAVDLGMSVGVVRALGQIYERFDGRGLTHIEGESIERGARALHIANLVEVTHRQGGRDYAAREVKRRRGKQLEPSLCDGFNAEAARIWSLLEATSVWDDYLAAEPEPKKLVAEERLDDIALAFGRYADLKSPSMLGHSPSVAKIAVNAAKIAGIEASEIVTLNRAALLHDLGSVSVANGVWDKPGPLNAAEWERVRLHAYYTERVLSRVPALSAVAALASTHHERCDASGYPRGAAPAVNARAARILAVADVYCALQEPRPHRSAIAASAAAKLLREEAALGKLCSNAVDCVLAATGEAPRPKKSPSGLTEREVEVVVHLAQGRTNKETAVLLGISPRTVQHHIEHIYEKIGVTTRAAAALYAVRNDLLASGRQ
jgi:DNA-binding CsgD family transcriptional regulator